MDVASSRILVLLEHPGCEDTHLGSTELISDHLLALDMAQINGMNR